jgi:hypothetical protein
MTKEECLDLYKYQCNSPSESQDATLKAMDEYAQTTALAYDEWKWANRWHSLENGFWYQTLEHPSAMPEKTYNKHHRKTPQELYNQFIEQQNKP